MISKIAPHYVTVIVLLVISLVILGVYFGTNQQVSGETIMPLDDSYIHFQYARQLANGQPYQYNPGDPPSSGATSFIYPYLLAPGYLIGFKGLNLGVWAMAVGTLALLIAGWGVYAFVYAFQQTSALLSLAVAALFMLAGAVSWHFMSGMETGLVIAATLATMYAFQFGGIREFSLSATLLALVRPEASLMAVIAVMLYGLRQWSRNRDAGLRGLPVVWLGPPIIATLIQPTLNFVLTGSLNASGTQAKSILSTVPFFWDEAISRILDNWARIGWELLTGTGSRYMPLPLSLLSVLGWVVLWRSRSYRLTAVLIVLWMLAVSVAIATLDTAFWHFKRYQMPLIAIQFVLAGVALSWLWSLRWNRRFIRAVTAGILLVAAWMTIDNALEFQRLYRVNLNNMMSQPLPMARWLQEHTPVTAGVAVHDVGMMRYIGERHTVDMVGLTTPDAAAYWRNGPGAVAEFLLKQQPPVDYIAAYTTARGLNYLADTMIYGDLLQGFTATYDPADNVALGAEFQGIFKPQVDLPHSQSLEQFHHPQIADSQVIDVLNVAELESEAEHDYHWHNLQPEPGFVTEAYEMDYAGCAESCRVVDGGRLISGEERFSIKTVPAKDVYLISQIHPFDPGTITIYANDVLVSRRVIPQIPGRWLDVATLIPADLVKEDRLLIRIIPDVAGFYMPYRHMIVIADKPGNNNEETPLARFQEAGAIELVHLDLSVKEDQSQLNAEITWQTDGKAQGDYKFFLHIYDDQDMPPVVQADGYPLGMLPPGNWLPGVFIDQYAVDLAQLAPGTYQIAIGFYEATTLERLVPLPVSDLVEMISGDRLFIGEVVLQGFDD